MDKTDREHRKDNIVRNILQAARLKHLACYVDSDGHNCSVSLNDVDRLAEVYINDAMFEARLWIVEEIRGLG